MKFLDRIFFILFICAFSNNVSAQYKVTFHVQTPSSHKADPAYIAGGFNGWSPQDDKYKFDAQNNYELQLPAGTYEYKFTRGGWDKVETTADGKGIGNRSFHLQNDTTITVAIGEWSDDFKQESFVKKHTASGNVKIIDTAFYIPQLKRTRRIWLYLPADYSNSKKRFAVLYMHDGQNLFDEFTAGFGEWGIDECLDSLFKKGNKECIVAGIDNGPKRMSEYNPYEFRNYGKGEGDAYIDFLAKTLKPFIDKHYRTLPDKKNTLIAGSSMGGLISLYAVVKYPNVFGGAGIFSPAFWTAPQLDDIVKKIAPKINSRLFFYAGGSESNEMVPDMKRIEEEIKTLSKSKTTEVVDPEAKHNEAAWRKYFPQFYLWIIK